LEAEMDDCAEKNYAWFKENLPELVKSYEDKYVVIKDEKLLAAYDAFNEAFDETIKTEKPGMFIIQLCSMDEEKTTVRICTPFWLNDLNLSAFSPRR
jgi:hypothetical protein